MIEGGSIYRIVAPHPHNNNVLFYHLRPTAGLILFSTRLGDEGWPVARKTSLMGAIQEGMDEHEDETRTAKEGESCCCGLSTNNIERVAE